MVPANSRKAGSNDHDLGYELELDLLGIRRYPIALCGRCLAHGVGLYHDYARVLYLLRGGVVALST